MCIQAALAVGAVDIDRLPGASRYQDFISDETKRKWRWRRLHEGEFEFWKQVVYGTYGAHTHAGTQAAVAVADRALQCFVQYPRWHIFSAQGAQASRCLGWQCDALVNDGCQVMLMLSGTAEL